MTVTIVTDSSARLPALIRERYRIEQVPMHVLTADQDLLEDVDDIGPDIFNDPQTTTSGVSPADLEAAYEKAVDLSDGDGVIAVHLSRRFSGTWGSARLAAEKFQGRIRVVDSRTVGLGVGFAAIAAAQTAETGADMDRAYEAAIRVGSTTECLLCVQQLENLRSSGRIGATTRLFASALAIKPILRVVDGTLALKEKQRTMSKAIAKMIDTAVDVAERRPITLGVQHCDAPELAEQIIDSLQSKLTITSLVQSDLGPVLSRHVGSGAVGIAVTTSLDHIDVD
ncbi:DegV family protein [Williamsia muralis]|uniref:DegV family protein n=1 Tax=Williamsia marianensis TaxID=85044 RepID=UPI000DE663CB|nr:DegV family protein [Williamsia marianensis]PVY34033.1 DegV family protein with EDD domain [Williamsia marianensis]